MIVGLTGGIGSGKSVVGNFFTELGIDVIDADHVSKNILDENKSAKKLFVEHFGDKFIDKNNNIDRALLRDEIFKDENKKEALESIIHPLVREEIFNFIKNSQSIYKIVMVPLIYETNSQDFYDKILVVECSEENQINRASKRDNKTNDDIMNIIKNQATSEQRKSIADEVINNDSSLNELKNQVIKIHQKFLGIDIND
tara:strand:+ start:67 stop:663 length:597 start_codon:yes stop_codon:yes gene_type:complete